MNFMNKTNFLFKAIIRKIFATYHIAFVILLLASVAPSSGGDIPAGPNDALRHLRRATSYSWTRITETPGASFTLKGKTDTNGFAVMELRKGGKSCQAVSKGSRRVVMAGREWKTSKEISAGKDAALVDARELLNSETPVDELALLLPKIAGLKLETDGSYSGVVDAGTVMDRVNSLIKSRAPIPLQAASSSGSFRIWLKNGLPQKYVLTVAGSVSLPFGKREFKRISTVSITDIGSTMVEVPANAKARLESVQ